MLSPQTCFVLVDDDNNNTEEEKHEKVVGYVIGTPDVHAFASAYPRYIKEVLQSPQGLVDVPPPKQLDTLEDFLIPSSPTATETGSESEEKKKEEFKVNTVCLAQHAYNPNWLVLEGPSDRALRAAVQRKKEMVDTWRAMLHIDLLEGYQGKGWGTKMIERFVEGVRESVLTDSGGKLDCGRGVYLGASLENSKVVKFYEKVGFKVFEGGEAEGSIWMVRDI